MGLPAAAPRRFADFSPPDRDLCRPASRAGSAQRDPGGTVSAAASGRYAANTASNPPSAMALELLINYLLLLRSHGLPHRDRPTTLVELAIPCGRP